MEEFISVFDNATLGDRGNPRVIQYLDSLGETLIHTSYTFLPSFYICHIYSVTCYKSAAVNKVATFLAFKVQLN